LFTAVSLATAEISSGIKHKERLRHLCLTIQTHKKEKTETNLRRLKFRRFQKKPPAQWPAPQWAA
jgi:hypothetical protein